MDGEKYVQLTSKVFHNSRIPGSSLKGVLDLLETTVLLVVDKKRGKYGQLEVAYQRFAYQSFNLFFQVE